MSAARLASANAMLSDTKTYTGHHLGGGYGNAGMRPERRPRRQHKAGRRSRSARDADRKAINPRGLGTASPY